MAQSRRTKLCRQKLWLYRILDLLCLVTPILVYIYIGLTSDALTAQKVALCGCVTIAIILTLINIVAQKHLRCPIWICLLGTYICMKEYLLPLVIILACTSILDDLLFTPIIQHYKTALVANKEIDKREEDEKLEKLLVKAEKRALKKVVVKKEQPKRTVKIKIKQKSGETDEKPVVSR